MDMDAEGMRVDLLEETLDRLEREGRRPKFVYTVPSFQNPAGVTLSAPRRRAPGGGGARARAAGARGQPVRAAPLRGRAAPDALLARRRRLRHVPRARSRRPSRPGSASAGWPRRRPVLEKINLGKQAADLCTSTLSQLMVAGLLRAGPLARLRGLAASIYRARRDAMLDALAEHFPPQAEWTQPAGGLFIWATLPDFIDTTDLLARALRGERGVRPGRGRVSRRPRRQLDAAQLLRLATTTRSSRGSAASAR